jgi:hypothetical protein
MIHEGKSMGEIRVETERVVAAPQAGLFKLVADYDGRPSYLPPNYEDWRVEQGGLGGGTVVTYRLLTGRRERFYRMLVEEETVGSVLVERDTKSSLTVTWTLTEDDPSRTRVRIVTRWRGAGGVGGLFERRFAPPGLRRIQDDLLARLDRHATEVLPPPPPPAERQPAPPAPATLPSAEFPDDLREPVGPAARQARASRDGRTTKNGKQAPKG